MNGVPVLCIYGHNWDICEYDSGTDSIKTPWDFTYNSPPIHRLNHPIPIRMGLFKTIYTDKLVVFRSETEAIRITAEGLKYVSLVHGIKEYWIRAFKESLPEKPEDWKTLLIKNLGLVLMAIITIIAVIT